MENIEIIKTEIDIGLEKPVRLLHVTDCHISHADDFDSEELHYLASGRKKGFDNGNPDITEKSCEAAFDYAKQNGIPVVCTGDLVDFISHANYEYLDRMLSSVDYYYAAGNHDFCHYVGRDDETYDYKKMQLKYVAPHIKDNLFFDSHVCGGVNIITLDDSYYRITDGQTDLLRAEAAKGLPMVLFIHNPLYCEKYVAMRLENKQCPYVVAAPSECLARYTEDRRLQQTPDEATIRAFRYILSEKLIKAVIAGHTHINYEEPLANGVMQYMTDGTFHGYAREIVFK